MYGYLACDFYQMKLCLKCHFNIGGKLTIDNGEEWRNKNSI